MATNAKEQVFVVISDPQINYLLERILRSAGYIVTVIRERSSAEKMLEKASPSLVIISEKLVDGNGLDLARSLLERHSQVEYEWVEQVTQAYLRRRGGHHERG